MLKVFIRSRLLILGWLSIGLRIDLRRVADRHWWLLLLSSYVCQVNRLIFLRCLLNLSSAAKVEVLFRLRTFDFIELSGRCPIRVSRSSKRVGYTMCLVRVLLIRAWARLRFVTLSCFLILFFIWLRRFLEICKVLELFVILQLHPHEVLMDGLPCVGSKTWVLPNLLGVVLVTCIVLIELVPLHCGLLVLLLGSLLVIALWSILWCALWELNLTLFGTGRTDFVSVILVVCWLVLGIEEERWISVFLEHWLSLRKRHFIYNDP